MTAELAWIDFREHDAIPLSTRCFSRRETRWVYRRNFPGRSLTSAGRLSPLGPVGMVRLRIEPSTNLGAVLPFQRETIGIRGRGIA